MAVPDPDHLGFDIFAIVREFERQRVEYILIGGGAGILHGATRITEDLDFLIRGGMENLHRTAQALGALGAKTQDGQAPDHDDLRGANTLWKTRFGRVDVLVTATGPKGSRLSYPDLVTHAVAMKGIPGTSIVVVASLDDLILMKRAAGRPKDHEALPELEALRDAAGES